MSTFEITVQHRTGESWPVVVQVDEGDGSLPVRIEGTLRLDVSSLLPLALDPQGYGTILGQALFVGAVRDAFAGASARSEAGLRVLLSVEAPDLRALRWERLCAPRGERWTLLALDQRAPFSLYLPSQTERRFPPIGRRDLRALILVASPRDPDGRFRLAPFDAAAAARGVREALGGIRCDVLGPPEVEGAVGPPTLDALAAQLTEQPYTLLHAVCHGRFFGAGGETVIYLAASAGDVDPVPATRLLDRLDYLGGRTTLPRFAFLSTCDSGTPAAEAQGALGGLAQRLVRDLGMPAVLAMTDSVPVEQATRLAGAFYERLKAHGEVDRALVESTAGLAGLPGATIPALYSRLGRRPLFSDSDDRALTPAEIDYGLGRLEALLPQRAPVLLPDLAAASAILRGTAPGEPAPPPPDATASTPDLLSGAAREERRQALQQVETLCLEATDLSFPALARGKEPPAYDSRCPFRGLYPFRLEDREFFFGREALVARLQERLAEHPFLAILGPSGSGKSSLALAGLVPALQVRSPAHRLAYLRPGSAPLTQLQSALQEAGPGPLIVVADQFEELFTHTQDETQRLAFLELLLAPAPDRIVVLTMRADFLGECAAYPALREAMQAHEELIASMDGPDLRRAIDQQAGVVGLRFEAELSFTIVEDVQNEPGAMPLLQHALMELWHRRHGRWLRVAEYHAIGKVQQAIAHTADQLYAQTAQEEQVRMRDVFVRLTRLGEEGAEGQAPTNDARRDTRRRVPLDELIPAGADPALTRALVQRLADTRLVVTDRNAALGRDEVELAHEALIRYWPRLRRWLNEDRTALRLRDGILMAARDWQASATEVGARDESLLVHRGTRLDLAWALLEAGTLPLNELERDYIEACVALRERLEAEEEARRQRELQAVRALAAAEGERAAAETRRAEEARRGNRRLRALVGGLAALAIVSAITAFFAFQQASLAELRGVAGPAVTQLNVRPETALLLGAVVSREARGASLLGGQVSLREARGLMLQQRAFSSSFGTFSSGHEGEVQAVAFSPTGDVYATAGRDRQIQLWNARTRERRGEPLKGHENAVRALAFSPDGALLASGGADNSARLWDVATGRPRGEPLRDPALSDEVLSVAFHPQRPLLATGSSDHKVILWDLTTSKPAQEPLQGDSGWVESLAFDREGKYLAAGTRNSLVLVWDLERTQQPLFRLGADRVQGHTGEVRAVAFKDSQFLASGGQDRTVRLWDLNSGQQVGYPIIGHSGWVESLSFSREGILASSSRDRTVSLWRVLPDLAHDDPPAVPAQQADVLRGHTDTARSVAFSPDGTTLVSGGNDGRIILWDVQQTMPLTGHTRERGDANGVESVAFTPDGKVVASGAHDHTVIFWDVTTRKQVGTPLGDLNGQTCRRDDQGRLEGRPDEVRTLAFAPDGRTLAAGTGDSERSIRLWRWISGSPSVPGSPAPSGTLLCGHTKKVLGVDFNRDGTLLASVSEDGTLRLWNVGTGEARLLPQDAPSASGAPLAHEGKQIWAVAFSPDGRTLATAGDSGTLRLWDVEQGTLRAQAPTGQQGGHTSRVTTVAFSPDGRTLATGSEDRTVRFWEAQTLQPRGEPLRGHGEAVRRVAFNAGGDVLASGANDRTIWLWDVETRLPLSQPLTGHTHEVWDVAFSPTLDTLASVSKDLTVRLWSLDLSTWRDQVCRAVGRDLTDAEWRQFVDSDSWLQRLGVTRRRVACPATA